ncbi:hypothetical protein PV325_013641 [Microctonus aethiopoides]|nr:hypothetical protein PV325_013641 [Microctonus aethiopoides]
MTTPATRLHQQQSHPVRYFQIHKPPRSQYNLQIASHLHHQQQQQQYNNPHYPQHYALISTSISPDNSMNLKKYENNLSISYFANQSASKSIISSQNINIKPLDDRQYNCQAHGVQNEIGHQPKYIITNGHSTVLPGEISFTTCLTLTNWIERLCPTIIHNNFNSDCLPIPPQLSPSSSTVQSVYAYRRNEEYLQRDDRNLIEQLRQPVSNINSEFSIAINPRNWSLLLKRTRNRKTNIINERLNNLHNQKTYADVLQDTRKYNCDKLKNMELCKKLTSSTMNNSDKKKRIHSSKNNDININESTATFIARAAKRTSRGSSTDSGLCLDDSIKSDSIDNPQITDDLINDIDEQKSFNKIAEDFCFGPLLDDSSLLNVFDKYCQERKRMTYTNLLAQQSNNESFNVIMTDNSDVYTTNLLNGRMANHSEINSTYFHHHRQQQQDEEQWRHDNLYNIQSNDQKKV